MGRILRLLKSDFTSGEVDPLLHARQDIKHYFTGAERMRNVFVIPQGGFKDRPGLKFVNDVSATASGNDPDDGARFISFEFSFSPDVTYLLLFLDQEIRVYKDGEQVHTITGLTQWTGDKLDKLNWTQSNDTLIIFHPEIQPYRILRVSDTSWTVSALSFDYIPKYDYSPTSSNPLGNITPSDVDGEIKISSAGSVWTLSHVGQKVEGNGGLARIVQFNSSSSVVAVVEIPFYNTDSITSGEWTLLEGFEDVWSNTRGWPACGTFHDGRLWMGGGPRPSTIWGSRIGSFFDFESGTGLDDEPIDLTLDTDQLNDIVNLFSLRDLVIFTTGGEFYVPERPITPNSSSTINATRRGSQKGLRVQELDGAALFVQRGGKAIREFVLIEDGSGNYVSDNLSLLSSHMINNPIDFSKRKATSTDENDLLILINTDGTAAICSAIRSQQVIAWSTMDTPNGVLQRVGVDDTDIYFLVKRTVNGVSKWFVEMFDSTLRHDSAVYVDTSSSATSTITAAHLLNEDNIHCYADDNYQGDFTLDGSGQATIPNESDNYYEAGYYFEVEAKTLPIEPSLPEGTSFNKKKRIIEIASELSETEHVVFNDREVTFKKFGVAGSNSPLDVDGKEFSGRHTEEGFVGFSEEAQITISKNRPGKMTVLALTATVSV
ncbi:MAG: hypothetical protein MI685_00020 [Chlorobiales bacterium]|nr:hypothetical protein [Chlorobiales bacterium]